MPTDRPHLPRQVPIEAYGSGGFRFAEMSHRGSLLCLPSGVYAWAVASAQELSTQDFSNVFAESSEIDLFVLGAGDAGWAMPEPLRKAFRDCRIGLEISTTGGAIRTYNIVLGERRRVAAGLIAAK